MNPISGPILDVGCELIQGRKKPPKFRRLPQTVGRSAATVWSDDEWGVLSPKTVCAADYIKVVLK